MNSRSISLYDLMEYPEATKAIKEQDEEALNKILYDLGFDVAMGIEYEDVYHRPLKRKTNDPVYGTRIVGWERSDPEFLRSGYATWENLLDNCGDSYLRDDLLSMGQQSNNSAAIIAHISKGKEE